MMKVTKDGGKAGNTVVLLTGATGFLGKKIYGILSKDFKVVGIGKTKDCDVVMDLLDQSKLESFIESSKPDIIIHTVAIADPDICENNQEEAYAVNVKITQYLCQICREKNIKLIFISTDYVFDGDYAGEYLSGHERQPKNYYGLTKVWAEDLVTKLDDYLLIRMPILYGFNDAGDKETFVTKIIKKMADDNEIFLDNEQTRYPVLIDDVAIALKALLAEGAQGIWQISRDLPVTKYTWGKLIAETFSLNADLIKPQKAGGDMASRPKRIKMDTSRINTLDIAINNVDMGLRIMHQQMKRL